MTALPQPPAHLLTVAEYTQLGETTIGYTELQEGNLIMSPSSSPRHMIASGRLLLQVQSQLPDDLCAVQEADIDEPVTLLDCHLTGPLGYAAGGSITGTFTTTAPCPIRLELGWRLR